MSPPAAQSLCGLLSDEVIERRLQQRHVGESALVHDQVHGLEHGFERRDVLHRRPHAVSAQDRRPHGAREAGVGRGDSEVRDRDPTAGPEQALGLRKG